MGILYVAASKALQKWGSDVGLGKTLYLVGWVEDGTPEARLSAGLAGETDWVVLTQIEAEGPEEALMERLARKEKLVDPRYYPRLKGAGGIVKVNPVAVENALLVAIALDNREPPKGFKVKPADIANHLIANILK